MQLILTNVGAKGLNVEAVQKAMNSILGQDSKVDQRGNKNKMNSTVYYNYDDVCYEDDDE